MPSITAAMIQTHTGQKPQVYSESSPAQRLQEIHMCTGWQLGKVGSMVFKPLKDSAECLFLSAINGVWSSKGLWEMGLSVNPKVSHAYKCARHKQKNTQQNKCTNTHMRWTVFGPFSSSLLSLFFFLGLCWNSLWLQHITSLQKRPQFHTSTH